MKRVDLDIRGSNYTRSELEQIRRKLSKRANQRLRELEKAGRAYYAYDSAINFTQRTRGRKRFNESSKSDKSDMSLKEEIDTVIHFLNSKTSTLRGHKEVDKRIIQTFRNKGLTISDPQSFLDFLSSSTFQKISNNGIPSSFLQDFFDRAKEEEVSGEEIKESLKEFEDGIIDSIDELYQRVGMRFLEDD